METAGVADLEFRARPIAPYRRHVFDPSVRHFRIVARRIGRFRKRSTVMIKPAEVQTYSLETTFN